MAKVNAPGVAGVLVYRDLQLVFDKVPGARLKSATPSLALRPPPMAVEGTWITALLAGIRALTLAVSVTSGQVKALQNRLPPTAISHAKPGLEAPFGPLPRQPNLPNLPHNPSHNFPTSAKRRTLRLDRQFVQTARQPEVVHPNVLARDPV